MTRHRTPNLRRISFQRECYQELEQYLLDRDMSVYYKEFLLDLAAMTDFLSNENYVGAHYLAVALNEKLKTLLPVYEKLARLHVPDDYTASEILHDLTKNRTHSNEP
jgi:hypothetical protein